MVDNGLRKMLMVIIIVAVIVLSGLFFNQFTKQGSADLTITSAIVKPAYQGFNISYDNNSLYTMHINLHIKFNGQMRVDGYLSPCSFDLGLNSTIWDAPPTTCTGIIGEHSYSGSHDFTIDLALEPRASNSTISPPFNLSFMVFSNAFNVTSQYYNLPVTNSSELQASMKITHVSLDNFTKQGGATGYNINTTVLLTTNHQFNVTYDCSPFSIIIFQNSSSSSTSFGNCGTSENIYYFPSGTSEYTLTTQLYNPSGQEFNNVTSYPSNTSVQIILANDFLKSNIYKF